MKKPIKTLLRTLYLLPALGVLFSGNASKDEGGITALFNPEKAEADIPYAQSAYQDYYDPPLWGGGDSAGDCPAPGPGPDSPSPSPSPDACC